MVMENTNNSRGEDDKRIWYVGHCYLEGLWSTEVREKLPFRSYLLFAHVDATSNVHQKKGHPVTCMQEVCSAGKVMRGNTYGKFH